MHKQATIKDVARRAGVNPSTVSRALNAKTAAMVKTRTRERIRRVATALNYRPNALARGLKVRQTYMLALFFPEIANPHFPEIARGIEDACRHKGYHLFICDLKAAGAVPQQRYLTLLEERRVDGLIISPMVDEDVPLTDLIQSQYPFVIMNGIESSAGNYVTVDDIAGAKLAVAHLAALGHRRIAYLSPPLVYDVALQRYQGFRQGLTEHDVPYRPELVRECAWFPWGGAEHGQRMMAELLAIAPAPTAVIAGNSSMAAGAMTAIREAGFTIPRQISVISLLDAPMNDYLAPPLTAVKVPLYEMGRQAAMVLIEKVAGRPETRTPILLAPSGLNDRQSTAAPDR